MERKFFLQRVIAGTGGLVMTPALLYSRNKHLEGDPLPAEKVKEFVIAGHGNFDNVKKLLTEFPTLLYATWDWGNGDFETALEGAGHKGNKEIANYLIGLGARTNLFVLTMLGKTQIVKPFLDAFPQYLNARGPHGLTFLHHAQKGGDDAKELLDYFQSRGLKETKAAL
jgi:ankyrin repeat protein